MSRKKGWVFCLLAMCLMFLMAFGRQAKAAEKKDKLVFAKKYGTIVMKKGTKKTLSVKCKKKKVSAKKLKWTSSKKSVVSVKNGKLTAKKNGKATISVKWKKGKSNTLKCKVYVYKKKKSTSFTAKINDAGNYLLNKGKSVKLKMKKKGSYTTFSSSNKKVATVSKDGTVKGVKAGTATITGVSVGSSYRYKASIKIKVGKRATGIWLASDGDEITSGVGDNFLLQAKVTPNNASIKELSYMSSDPEVASVSGKGMVEAESEGVSVITIKTEDGSDVEKKVRIYVTEDDENVSSLDNEEDTDGEDAPDITGQPDNDDVDEVERTINWVAHRGLSSQAPENTIPAFKLAGKNGFSAIECDVRETKDGALVLSHDDTLKRMCGANKKIASLTLAQVRKYDVTGGANAKKYKNNKIPTLEEYIECCNQYGCIPMIEVKTPMSRKGLQSLYQTLPLADEEPIVISFSDDVLEELREWDKSLSLQKVTKSLSASELKKCKKYNWDVDMKYANVTQDTVEKVHEAGLLLNVWTINSKSVAKLFGQWGADYITSDKDLVGIE